MLTDGITCTLGNSQFPIEQNSFSSNAVYLIWKKSSFSCENEGVGKECRQRHLIHSFIRNLETFLALESIPIEPSNFLLDCLIFFYCQDFKGFMTFLIKYLLYPKVSKFAPIPALKFLKNFGHLTASFLTGFYLIKKNEWKKVLPSKLP